MDKAKKIDTKHDPEPLDEKLEKLIDKTKSENDALKKILKGLEDLNKDGAFEISKKNKKKNKKK